MKAVRDRHAFLYIGEDRVTGRFRDRPAVVVWPESFWGRKERRK